MKDPVGATYLVEVGDANPIWACKYLNSFAHESILFLIVKAHDNVYKISMIWFAGRGYAHTLTFVVHDERLEHAEGL